jgi:hypothetical protein
VWLLKAPQKRNKSISVGDRSQRRGPSMSISPIVRLAREYRALGQVLSARDFLALIACGVINLPGIVRTRNLTSVDSAMGRNLEIRYHNRRFLLPLADIDAILAPHHDNPTFGNVREMYANDSYLRLFHLQSPARVVLDLGANRGLFSLIALMALDANIVVGVEPLEFYEPVMRLLLDANKCAPDRVIRYNKLIGSSPAEQRDPSKTISINRIREEQKITRFDMVKVDIEGGERDIFGEPDWLPHVDNITMELHHFAGNLEMIPQALERYGFRYLQTDQFGRECQFKEAMFLYASRTGALG